MLLAFVSSAAAQLPTTGAGGGVPATSGPPPSWVANAHVKVLLSLLDEWDQKKLTFPGRDALTREFEARLEQRIQAARFGYENDTWRTTMLTRWRELPSDFGPQLALSDGAKAALLAGFVDNLESLSATPPQRDPVWQLTRMPLYALLSSSQQRAQRRQRNVITSTEVQESLSSFLTSVYPLCRVPAALELMR
jgi:hypothetical protein